MDINKCAMNIKWDNYGKSNDKDDEEHYDVNVNVCVKSLYLRLKISNSY